MSTEAKKLDIYAEWAALPDTVMGEIIMGNLHISPRPGRRHAQAASVLGSEVTGPFHIGRGGPGGWWILDEPELHLSGDILVPDLAGWKKERLAKSPADQAYFDIAPDWVCEVLSPKTAGLDRVNKLPIYLREKVNHVWLVDPVAKTLEVYRREESRWIIVNTFAGEELIRAEPFDEVEIDLGVLWLPDDPVL